MTVVAHPGRSLVRTRRPTDVSIFCVIFACFGCAFAYFGCAFAYFGCVFSYFGCVFAYFACFGGAFGGCGCDYDDEAFFTFMKHFVDGAS